MLQEEIKLIELIQNIKKCFEDDNFYLNKNILDISKNFEHKNNLLKEFLSFNFTSLNNFKNIDKEVIKYKIDEVQKIILKNHNVVNNYIKKKHLIINLLKENSKNDYSTYDKLGKSKSIFF